MNTQPTQQIKTIPVGYREDARGNLVNEDNIRDIDLARDDFVNELVEKAKVLQKAMLEFKQVALGDVGAFVDMSVERYDVHLGGRKGNVTLTNFDGTKKVQYNIQERLTFNEGLIAAKKLIDELLHEWTEDAGSEIKAIINQAFEMDKEGNLSTARILSLRKIQIDNPRWLAAMDAISDSLTIAESKSYIRFYERGGQDGELKAIPLDLAKL